MTPRRSFTSVRPPPPSPLLSVGRRWIQADSTFYHPNPPGSELRAPTASHWKPAVARSSSNARRSLGRHQFIHRANPAFSALRMLGANLRQELRFCQHLWEHKVVLVCVRELKSARLNTEAAAASVHLQVPVVSCSSPWFPRRVRSSAVFNHGRQKRPGLIDGVPEALGAQINTRSRHRRHSPARNFAHTVLPSRHISAF